MVPFIFLVRDSISANPLNSQIQPVRLPIPLAGCTLMGIESMTSDFADEPVNHYAISAQGYFIFEWFIALGIQFGISP